MQGLSGPPRETIRIAKAIRHRVSTGAAELVMAARRFPEPFRLGTGVGFLALAAYLLTASTALADEKEPLAVVELGGATEWNLRDGRSGLGPTAAVEIPVIKDWLEIEFGVTSLLGKGRPDWSADFVLKKPFKLSDTVEFMIGAGPEWKITDKSIAAELVLDFMIWPTDDRKFGWFVEPTYSYDLGKGHEQSIGVMAGLLIAIH
jgi:hypothetical protein